MGDKIYCGKGKEKRFDGGGSIISVMLDVDDLAANFKEHGFTTTEGRRKMRVKVCQKREPDSYGNTHYVEVDTWKPDPNRAANSATSSSGGGGSKFEDDIPFGPEF